MSTKDKNIFTVNKLYTFLFGYSNCVKKCFRENGKIYCYPLVCDLTFKEYDKLIENDSIQPKELDVSKIYMRFK